MFTKIDPTKPEWGEITLDIKVKDASGPSKEEQLKPGIAQDEEMKGSDDEDQSQSKELK